MPCAWCPDGVLELLHGVGPDDFHTLACVECGDRLLVPQGDPERIRERLGRQAGTRRRTITDGGTTTCPACGADSEITYRCEECGKDLVEDDDRTGGAPGVTN